MAIFINGFVTAGELNNLTHNSVTGWIEFGPDYGIRFELCGNLTGRFAGQQVSFETPKREFEFSLDNLPSFITDIAMRQIGVIGDVTLDPGDATAGSRASLMIEWFSQNDHIIVEIVDPEIQLNDYDSADQAPVARLSESTLDTAAEADCGAAETTWPTGDGHAITGHPINETPITGDPVSSDPEIHHSVIEFDFGPDQPSRLFHRVDRAPLVGDESGLDGNDSRLGGASEATLARGDEFCLTPPSPVPVPWDEVIPGLDPETKRMYEKWDEIYGGEHDVAVKALLGESFEMPAADTLSTDEEALPHLRRVIARLATYHLAIGLCEHLTPLSAYRMLVEQIIPEAQVHPDLASTEIVQHYDTWEYCTECEAEFDGSWPEDSQVKFDVEPEK